MTANFLRFFHDKEIKVEGIRNETHQDSSWLRLPSERGLLLRAQAGDRIAFDGLVQLHQTLLRGFLRRRLPSDAVEDVLQETFLAAWSALPAFKPRVRLKTWLYQIALHKSADWQRRCRRDLSLESLTNDLPDNKLSTTENAIWARALLAQLPDDQRILLELYYFDDLTLAEVALVLDRNLNTVKYHFYQAHARGLQLGTAMQKEEHS
ncbi:RNA polymerase sigma factor [Armatimonas sp.]|uniref:RNA polymerase sigma factor n=1 Tax=Armatimonas sp. TaxID=1872638 RepID=UPI00286B12E1|nr:RNA polymerase sigma factor [Armatimonas sp.]